jgi:hypothetical protein
MVITAATPIDAVHILHITPPQRFHQRPTGIGSVGRKQQMHMVRHQRISMNPAAGLARVLEQPIQIAAIIFIGEKARLAVVAALDKMDGNIGQGNSGATGHGKL